MPTVIRKSVSSMLEGREILHSVSWQVSSSVWSPPTDAFDTEKAYVVRMEIAGMREEDFEIAFQNGTLSIRGFRPDAPERGAYHQMEIRSGKFVTRVAVTADVDVDVATADYKDGFLTVLLPKTSFDTAQE
ncbi:MAG TPA: Hsp20/alpha crystallin family protein [Anaerolineales bacterium]|jgi:HSP20 family protein